MPATFDTDTEIESLVRGFETCELNPAEFEHGQHLAVALWYIMNFPFAEASAKMRSGIQKLAAAHGKNGYHETITIFWLDVVREFYLSAAAGDSVSSLANRLAGQYDKDVIHEYYSRELLGSLKAKNEWVPPDLKPGATG